MWCSAVDAHPGPRRRRIVESRAVPTPTSPRDPSQPHQRPATGRPHQARRLCIHRQVPAQVIVEVPGCDTAEPPQPRTQANHSRLRPRRRIQQERAPTGSRRMTRRLMVDHVGPRAGEGVCTVSACRTDERARTAQRRKQPLAQHHSPRTAPTSAPARRSTRSIARHHHANPRAVGPVLTAGRYAATPRIPPRYPTPLLRMRKARLAQLHDPLRRRVCRPLEDGEDPMPPTERCVLVHPQPPRRLPNADGLQHAARVLAPQLHAFRIGERRSCQIAEGATTRSAAVALPPMGLPPALDPAAPAAHAPEASREPRFSERDDVWTSLLHHGVDTPGGGRALVRCVDGRARGPVTRMTCGSHAPC